jgi:hypothetical protein
MTPEVASLRRRKKNMAKKILLSKTFALPARAVTESIAIMGRKGSGKTYTGGRLFEQMHGIGAQCVALDPVGNWWGLRSSATGKSLGLDIPIFGGEHGDIPITPGSGKIMAEVIVNRRISCVIDLKLFRANQRKEFVTDFAEELYHLKSTQRSPMHIFLEEARKFIPQKPMGKMDTRMIGAFEDIVRLGRNYGLGVSLIDQRPQSVNKEVLSQTELLILHQLTGTHERKVMKDWVQEKTVDGINALDDLASLQAGECFFWSPGLMRTFAQIKVGKKRTYDASATPELGDDDSYIKMKPLRTGDLVVLHESMAKVVEEIEAKDPVKLKAQVRKLTATIAKLEAQIANRPDVKKVTVPTFTIKEQNVLMNHAMKLGKTIGPLMAQLEQTDASISVLGKAIMRLAREGAFEERVIAKKARPELGPKPKHHTVPMRSPVEKVDSNLTGPEQRIVDAIGWMNDVGIEEPELTAVAFLAGYRMGGGGFNNPRGKLRVAGHVEYRGKKIVLTRSGAAMANRSEIPLTSKGLQDKVLRKLKGPEQRILIPLLEAYPEPMANDELAVAANYTAGSGGFNNPKGRLRTLGLINYPSPGMSSAADILFID